MICIANNKMRAMFCHHLQIQFCTFYKEIGTITGLVVFNVWKSIIQTNNIYITYCIFFTLNNKDCLNNLIWNFTIPAMFAMMTP